MQVFDQRRDFLKNIFADIPAAGTGISYQLFLVQALRDGEGFIGEKAVLAIGFFLQTCQVEQERRFGIDRLSFDLRNRQRAGSVCKVCGADGTGGGIILELGFTYGLTADARFFERELYVPIRNAFEVFVFYIAVAYHRQRGCLHSSQRVSAFSGSKREGAAGVDTH